MYDDTILLKLTVKRVGIARRIDGTDLEEVTGRSLSPAFFKATKKLWSCAEFDACLKTAGKARAFVAKKSVPAAFIGKGFHLLRAERYPVIDEGLTGIRAELSEKVAGFCEVYDERVVESQAELARQGIPFSADEYPSIEDVRSGFQIRWAPMDMGVPRSLERVSAEAFAEAKREAEARWTSALEDVERVLAIELKGLLDRMVERLTDEGGKKKIFRDSLVGNLRGFLEEMPFRNVCSSAQLDALCGEISEVLGSEDAASLRASPGMRAMIRDRMELISTTLDAAVINAPRRKIVRLLPPDEGSEPSGESTTTVGSNREAL